MKKNLFFLCLLFGAIFVDLQCLSEQNYAHKAVLMQQALDADKDSLQTKFQNILLVIHFNHPYYDNIPFLKELYSPYFKNIVFYGEKEHPDVHKILTHTGWLRQEYFEHVLSNYPDYEGYLFLEDDCILNVWNCQNFDLNKIWMPGSSANPNVVKFSLANRINVMSGEGGGNWNWWSHWTGAVPTKKAFDLLEPDDIKLLEHNLGKDKIMPALVDMCYIPARFRENMQRLNRLFINVFVEIAVPTMLCCLEDMACWEKASMLWGAKELTTICTSNIPWPSQFTCVHPVKLSNSCNREYLQTTFKRFLR